MSTKTNFKRVALVAVASMGLGVLTSVAPASAASDITYAATTAIPVAGQLNISIVPTTTGAANNNVGGTAANLGKPDNMTSLGWVSKTSTTGTAVSTTAYALGDTSADMVATGVVLSGAQIAFSVGATRTADTGVSVVVTGGTLSSVAAYKAAAAGDTLVNGSSTIAVHDNPASAASTLSGVFTINAAVGSVATLTAYAGDNITSTTTATNGDLLGSWTLTVASAATNGIYNAANSSIFMADAITKGTTAGGAAGTYEGTYDVSSRIDNGNVGVVMFDLKDAFLQPITTGTLTATATNGSTVTISNTGAGAITDIYGATTSFKSVTMSSDISNGDGYVLVNQPVANTAGSTTVTISHNGTVLATKTLNWNGDVASIAVDTVNSNSNFMNGADLTFAGGLAGVIYVAKDAAGNAVTLSAAPTVSGATGALVGASLAAITGTTNGAIQTATDGYGYGTMSVPSSTLTGTGTYKLKVLNSAGTSILSQEVTANVSASSGLDSFVASWDKASYNPGEIAVLTVTGKDTYGNVIADGTAAAGLSLTVAGSATAGLYAVGTACTTATVFSGGKFTCKFAANTEGAWSYSVDVTTNVNAQSATVGSLKITSGGGVSNADVLKAIVSLIASINKQIAALQKALLKK